LLSFQTNVLRNRFISPNLSLNVSLGPQFSIFVPFLRITIIINKFKYLIKTIDLVSVGLTILISHCGEEIPISKTDNFRIKILQRNSNLPALLIPILEP